MSHKNAIKLEILVFFKGGVQFLSFWLQTLADLTRFLPEFFFSAFQLRKGGKFVNKNALKLEILGFFKGGGQFLSFWLQILA